MSPIAIERGFTERFIEKGADEDFAARIKNSYEHVASGSDLVIIEGTGHAGVGSVFDLSNAVVAKLLDANVILISSGGIGRPIDEICLNKALFDREGVRLAGVIVNKVIPEKYDKISRLVRMGLEKKGIPVLGVLPYQKMLDSPTMREIQEEINLEVSAEGEGLDILAEQILIGAMRVRDAIKFIKNNTLMIIPGDRDDMIKAVCDLHMGKLKSPCRVAGMILSGGLTPKEWTMDFIRKSRIPTLATKEDTYTIASRIHSMIVKIKPQDEYKIEIIVDMVEKHLDVDRVIANLK
jgi:BioD-like phosphotransacetylase family protein